MIYRVSFRGREAGAIGIFSRFAITVRADNEEQARLKLYETHDHITDARFEPISVHIGDVLVHRGEPRNGNPYLGQSLIGEERVAALRIFKAGGNEAYTFWYAPACGGAFRIEASEVDWDSSGV
jgi:hypothetical protein